MPPRSKRRGRRPAKKNMPMLRLPAELLRVIVRLACSPISIKNLRCSAKSFRDLIKDADLISAYTHHIWDKYKQFSLDHVSHGFVHFDLGYFETATWRNHRINAFHQTDNSNPTAVVQRLVALGAQCPSFGSDILTTAVDTNNQPLLDILLGLGCYGYVRLEYLLQTCQTDRHSIVLALSRHRISLTYKASTLASIALKGWSATARLIHSQCSPVTLMERNDHLQIWLAAIRNGDEESIKYFTKHIPTDTCYGLITRAIKLKCEAAVRCLLKLPAKENGILKNARALLKLAREYDCKLVKDRLLMAGWKYEDVE
ncbi:hypothetical protein HK097_001578 [Rhizophlyctis rosea]|uniref:F-box domain-containing protein n=1 Tax=Rhizophlyctis rosea TaxID=64517 RepID=A0AAD5WY98_9FUNG|nr:hypothetical protein HK097_001578 [Rhizophlyctis rosea]